MSASAQKPRVEFGPCCFCGEPIPMSEVDPCHLTITTARDKWQVWFCHAACFKSRLVGGRDLEPAHF
jgi:hypothetical protein